MVSLICGVSHSSGRQLSVALARTAPPAAGNTHSRGRVPGDALSCQEPGDRSTQSDVAVGSPLVNARYSISEASAVPLQRNGDRR
jgi:hypothetical protein